MKITSIACCALGILIVLVLITNTNSLSEFLWSIVDAAHKAGEVVSPLHPLSLLFCFVRKIFIFIADYSERFPSDQERASQRTGIHSFFLSSFLLHFFLMNFFTFIGMHIHAQVNLVTETDLACEDLIFTHLKQVYPTHKVDSPLP